MIASNDNYAKLEDFLLERAVAMLSQTRNRAWIDFSDPLTITDSYHLQYDLLPDNLQIRSVPLSIMGSKL